MFILGEDTSVRPDLDPATGVSDARPRSVARRPHPAFRSFDGPSLARLDQLAEHAAASLAAGLAAVTLVDRRTVWLAGSFGFEIEAWARAGSLCNATVRSGAPLLVQDAAAEFRFRRHALVEAAGLRSYAAAPLTGAVGAFGTVALFAHDTDAFGPDVVRVLVGLAQVVEPFLAGLVSAVEQPPIQGWLGVRTHAVGAGARGLLILSVADGSPAEAAGLRPTDILRNIDGQKVSAPADLAAALAGRVAGSMVVIGYARAGRARRCTATVTRRPGWKRH